MLLKNAGYRGEKGTTLYDIASCYGGRDHMHATGSSFSEEQRDEIIRILFPDEEVLDYADTEDKSRFTSNQLLFVREK